MNGSDDDLRQEIALFRYTVIADLVHLPVGARGIGDKLRDKASQSYTRRIPFFLFTSAPRRGSGRGNRPPREPICRKDVRISGWWRHARDRAGGRACGPTRRSEAPYSRMSVSGHGGGHLAARLPLSLYARMDPATATGCADLPPGRQNARSVADGRGRPALLRKARRCAGRSCCPGGTGVPRGSPTTAASGSHPCGTRSGQAAARPLRGTDDLLGIGSVAPQAQP